MSGDQTESSPRLPGTNITEEDRIDMINAALAHNDVPYRLRGIE